MSMETAYLLVTDLHLLENNLKGRYSYKSETDLAIDNLLRVIEENKAKGRKVVLLFLGDIFHNSFDKVFESISYNNLIIYLRTLVDDMYSVVGNHELTFYKDNPFWTLFTEMKSTRVKSIINKVWQPRGTMDVLNVVDELIDGDVRFIFNHYDTGVIRPEQDGKKNIGLFHQDLYAKDIVVDLEASKGIEIFEYNPVYFDKSNTLDGYDLAFLGHMHMMYGKWRYVSDHTGYETMLYYLSTLGRTNHREVVDTMLERNLPAVIIRDGRYIGVEDNLFNLMSREKSVNEEVVLKSQMKRQELKERKEFREHTSSSDDPIVNIRTTLLSKPSLLNMLDQILSKGRSNLETEIQDDLEEMRWL